MTLRERARQLRADIPALFLSLKSGDTPLVAKVLTGLAIAYALSPIDLIPDFIPVLGFLDDLLLLPALVALAVKFIPRDVLTRCRRDAQNLWTDGRPKKWYYAVPIVLLWLALLGLAIKAIFLK